LSQYIDRTITSESERMSGPLVLGVGNYLLGDEGVGVHAVRKLEEAGVPTGVTVLDGGTGGFHLLSLFQDHDPIILIDATMDGAPAGTVRLLQPKFASEFPRTLSAHDIGLRDLLESAALLGPLPTLYLITVSIDQIQSMSIDLSPRVKAAIPEAVRAAREILATECV
jgi:hydrogenase maturation protease